MTLFSNVPEFTYPLVTLIGLVLISCFISEKIAPKPCKIPENSDLTGDNDHVD